MSHITGILMRAGKIDDTWFTEESCERGTAVHALTAAYDLDALNPATCVSRYRGYLLGHVSAMKLIGAEVLAVEEPRMHPVRDLAGRPDRVVRLDGVYGVLEIKTGDPAESHALQTALQCELVAADFNLPADALARWCLYLKDKGKYKLERHTRRADFDEARGILRRFAA